MRHGSKLCPTFSSPSIDKQLLEACPCDGDRQEHTTAGPTEPAHCRYLLMCHWPEQVTCLSPALMGQENIHGLLWKELQSCRKWFLQCLSLCMFLNIFPTSLFCLHQWLFVFSFGSKVTWNITQRLLREQIVFIESGKISDCYLGCVKMKAMEIQCHPVYYKRVTWKPMRCRCNMIC